MGFKLILSVIQGVASRVVKGAVVDTAKVLIAKPAGAVIDAVKEVAVDNVASPEGGEGKPDFIRLISTISTIGFAVAYFAGYISEDKLTFIATLFTNLFK